MRSYDRCDRRAGRLCASVDLPTTRQAGVCGNCKASQHKACSGIMRIPHGGGTKSCPCRICHPNQKKPNQSVTEAL
jgi:hypothetical protein